MNYLDVIEAYRDVVDFSTPLQCDAKSKRSGQRCKKSAIRFNTKCRNHCGTKNPMDNIAWYHGQYHKPEYITPKALRDRQRIFRIKHYRLTGEGGFK